MMKKHKNKIVIAAVVIALLAGAWFMSGMDNRGASNPTPPPSVGDTSSPTPAAPVITLDAPTSPTGETSATPTLEPSDSGNTAEPTAEPTDEPIEIPTESPDPVETEPPPTTTPEVPPETAVPTQDINPETGKDKYLTNPVPSGQPIPVEPQDVIVGDGSFTVTLSVRCDTLLDNMDSLDKEKHDLVPEDGIIFPTTTVTVYEGESVFNVLQREMRRAKIHMEFVNTPIYNSAYIEGINNLYEFDGGELSGWMYKVNDWFPNYGCSRYQLKAGDVIEWVYTCDLGRDVGGYYAVFS